MGKLEYFEVLTNILDGSNKGPFGTDELHEDGSKTYGTCSGRLIYIKRPVVVSYIEEILVKNYMGWTYMAELNNLFKSKLITEEEFRDIIRILD